VHDYLRLLFARIGVMHCPNCDRLVTRQTPQQIVDLILEGEPGAKFLVLASLVEGRKGEYSTLIESLEVQGFSRVRIDGEVLEMAAAKSLELARYESHSIEVVLDRLTVNASVRQRLTESVEAALKLAKGTLSVYFTDTNELVRFSENLACVHCGLSFTELAPRDFSFNSPYGACPACTGLGTRFEVAEDLVVPDPTLSIREGALAPWGDEGGYFFNILQGVAELGGFSLDAPWKSLRAKDKRLVLNGVSGKQAPVRVRNRYGRVRTYETTYNGLVEWLERQRRDASGDWARDRAEQYMREVTCRTCNGSRLRPEVLAVRVAGQSIARVEAHTIDEALSFFQSLSLSAREATIATQIVKEIVARLSFLLNVGLDYLSLNRASATLSGGEAQRIRLASQIGSALVGVLYVLDEPSIGLHQRDNQRLIATLVRLRDLGNSVIVVEHDEETIRAADFVVDVGPGAGEHGGEIVVAGSIDDLLGCATSLTGQYLSGALQVSLPHERRVGTKKYLTIKGARANNLQNVTVKIPLGTFTAVTGVSGSGKSTLINEILLNVLERDINGAYTTPAEHDKILGMENLDKVVAVNQQPIGRTPRSNPATYTGVFDKIRALFVTTTEARARGYQAGRFSFNVKGGRCEACSGDGTIKIEMHFLPDVYVTCETCGGSRYNRETLEVLYRGKSIGDVLNMPIAEALSFFEHQPTILRHVQALVDVGLGYVRLGQPATTLSGGEAQRVKLAKELARRSTGHTFYVLDEPTTGLHFADVAKLLEVLQRLVDQGNSVLVIEHNLEVVKTADWVIDLGPEGGRRGGLVIGTGTPEQIASLPTATGEVLRHVLNVHESVPVPKSTAPKAKRAVKAGGVSARSSIGSTSAARTARSIIGNTITTRTVKGSGSTINRKK
jgi:excinuclease ABC subunit A